MTVEKKKTKKSVQIDEELIEKVENIHGAAQRVNWSSYLLHLVVADIEKHKEEADA
jgi:hypothetical protein